MSSTDRLRDANASAETARTAKALTSLPHALIVHLLEVQGPLSAAEINARLSLGDRRTQTILSELSEMGTISESGDLLSLSPEVMRRLSFRSLSLDFICGQAIESPAGSPHRLAHSYQVIKRIGSGSTSFTFLAEQSGTHQQRTLKVFLPGTVKYQQLDNALVAYSHTTDSGDSSFPDILDAGEVLLRFPDSSCATVPAIALKYISAEAKPLAQFVKEHDNLDSTFFERFIDRVARSLQRLERAGLQHGDLHEGNILVLPGSEAGAQVQFWVIDFVGLRSSNSDGLETMSDLDCFREHLIRTAVLATQKYPGYSARRLLGDRAFRVLQGLRANRYENFDALISDFSRSKRALPPDYFHAPPQPFEWLRVEWIPTPDWLIKLFVSVPSRFEIISRFGNTWISGPRGCGKSHYLRVLAFQAALYAYPDALLETKLAELGCDFRKTFGVLFACRLGEFKAFDPEAMGQADFDIETRTFLKHILVLKIINKTLYTIREGLETRIAKTGEPVLEMPDNVKPLLNFVEERLGSIALISPGSAAPTFRQCLGTTVAKENADVAVWNKPALRPATARLLNEADLDQFFSVLRAVFPDLTQSRFYLLVDDVTYGHVHYSMQRVLNSLIRSQQANHCFKITFEKSMYTADSDDDRGTDPRNEVTYIDLGEVSVRAQKDTGFNYSDYMADVVNLRLGAQKWANDIRAILGKSQDPDEFLSALSGVRWGQEDHGATTRTPITGRALYAGWNVVCSIAHGSVRTLLEIVESIFTDASATSTTESISVAHQDTTVRNYSRRQFRVLTLLPGEIDGEPIGQQLQSIISSVGEMSKQYLRNYDTRDSERWYETLSIERLDDRTLDYRASRLLAELIKYGLLLQEGVTFSRADIGLKPRYDLNKVFSPVFEITYRVRNHLYLSSSRLDELLLYPDAFVRRHRQRLQLLDGSLQARQQELF